MISLIDTGIVFIFFTGFLVTATDPDLNHVNGTHIDFVQKGDNPSSREPMFVVYTDQGKKKGSDNLN